MPRGIYLHRGDFGRVQKNRTCNCGICRLCCQRCYLAERRRRIKAGTHTVKPRGERGILRYEWDRTALDEDWNVD